MSQSGYGDIMSLVCTQYFTVRAAVRAAHPTVVGLFFAGTFILRIVSRTYHHGSAPDWQAVRTAHPTMVGLFTARTFTPRRVRRAHHSVTI